MATALVVSEPQHIPKFATTRLPPVWKDLFEKTVSHIYDSGMCLMSLTVFLKLPVSRANVTDDLVFAVTATAPS